MNHHCTGHVTVQLEEDCAYLHYITELLANFFWLCAGAIGGDEFTIGINKVQVALIVGGGSAARLNTILALHFGCVGLSSGMKLQSRTPQ